MTNTISTINNIAKNAANSIVARIESEEKGQSMVEMALVLGFLLLMTFGMIDMARCIYTNSVVSAAAQEGVRAGIVDPGKIQTGEIRTVIANKMVGLNMDSAVVNVTTNGDIIEVEITYDFEFVTPMPESLVDSLSLNGKASMVTM